MKNIAILCPTLNSGGAERIAGLLSKKLSEHYNVYVFLLDTTDIVYDYGGTIVDIGSASLFVEKEILKQKRKYMIDVAISFMETLNFYNIKTKGTEKVVIVEQNAPSQYVFPRHADNHGIKIFYDFADEIVACSYGVAYDLSVNYGIKKHIQTIYNFVDNSEISGKSKDPFPEEVELFLDGADYFVNVGRFVPQKNQKEIIRQFALYSSKTCSNEKLLIFGEGPLREELNRQVSQLSLDDKVRIFKFDKNPFRYMKRARAMLLGSRFEGMANVILEAMMVGCPVISTDCLAGPRELLDDRITYDHLVDSVTMCKRGILVPVQSEDCMAQAIEMIRNKEIRAQIVQNGLDSLTQFSDELLFQKWVELIESETAPRSGDVPNEFKKLDEAEHIILYGAGMVGKQYYAELSKYYKIDCFAVTSRDENQKEINGVPVVPIRELVHLAECAIVVVAVGEKYKNEIVRVLTELGFKNIICQLY